MRSRGDRAIHWVERFCVSGGRRVMLTPAERDTIRRIYDGGEALEVSGALAAYLALLHICGPEAPGSTSVPYAPNIFAVWGAAGPALREVLRRGSGGAVICPELGTRYPPTAA